jgi:hypothetical protein
MQPFDNSTERRAGNKVANPLNKVYYLEYF